MAIMLPPLQLARAQARRAKCTSQLNQLGVSLTQARDQFRFYPLWDDGAALRYTWVDVLIQQRYFLNRAGAYCP